MKKDVQKELKDVQIEKDRVEDVKLEVEEYFEELLDESI